MAKGGRPGQKESCLFKARGSLRQLVDLTRESIQLIWIATGEPSARKRACSVRGGAVGNTSHVVRWPSTPLFMHEMRIMVVIMLILF